MHALWNTVALVAAAFVFGLLLGGPMSTLRRRAFPWTTIGFRRKEDAFTAVDVHGIEWRQNQQHRDKTTYYMKRLPCADRSGHALMLVRYPAGEINPSHVHQVGHGIYVLSGELVTHRGTYGPHQFVWFPPGEVMSHGAGESEELVALFSADAGMETRYVTAPPSEPSAAAR